MEMILAADITVAATDAKIGIPTIKPVGFRMGQYSPSSENGRRFQSQGAFIYWAQPLRRKR